MNLDPHIKQLADVLVGICVRELKKAKPDGESGYCKVIPLEKEGWDDANFSTNQIRADTEASMPRLRLPG